MASFAAAALPTATVGSVKRLRSEIADGTQRDVPSRAAIIHAIRLALGISSRLREVRDWRDVLRAAVVEKCAPLAWLRCGAAIGAAAPVEISAAFRSHFVANTARARSMLTASCATAAVLELEGIFPIILKGPPLAARLYGDSAARVCSDLDWFVSDASRNTMHRVMMGEGWTCIEGERDGDPCYGRHGEWGEIYLEVHSSLLHARYGYLPLPAPLAKRARIDGLAVLAHDGSLLPGYLSAHLATHRGAPLAWLIDLLELWNSLSPRERGDARAAAARAGVDRYLSWAMRRATLLHCAATGDERAADRLGIGDAGRVEPHPMWRHIALAPGIRGSVRAARSWIAPSWVTAQGSAWVVTMIRRIATHWREVLHVDRDFMRRDGTARHATASIRGPLPAEDTRTFRAVRQLVERGDEVWIVVTGASMRPTLDPGDRVLLAPATRGVNVGNIVLADHHGRPLLHRIVGRRADVFSTIGDNCLRPDPPIRLANVVARAEAVHSAHGLSALRATTRFGLAALARFVGLEARARLLRLWYRARYFDGTHVWNDAEG
jgi:hypothetical protein